MAAFPATISTICAYRTAGWPALFPQEELTQAAEAMPVPNIEPGTVHYNALLTYAKFIRSKGINNDYGTERRLTPCLRWPD